MANMRFALGIRRELSLVPHPPSQTTNSINRTRPLPRLSPCPHDPHRHRHHPPLPPSRRLLLILPTHPQYLPHIALLPELPPIFDPAQVDPGVTTAIANIVGGARLEVRVGYFGICINADGGSFLCSNNASSLAGQVSVDQDPLNLIWVASTFKDSIVFPYLM